MLSRTYLCPVVECKRQRALNHGQLPYMDVQKGNDTTSNVTTTTSDHNRKQSAESTISTFPYAAQHVVQHSLRQRAFVSEPARPGLGRLKLDEPLDARTVQWHSA